MNKKMKTQGLLVMIAQTLRRVDHTNKVSMKTGGKVTKIVMKVSTSRVQLMT